ncbi:hypothetical protein HAX54_017319 [Datura stramonium]|uniref:Uncharacterized protein n=1 Tax=Datura stramonium TaxID=4076 RepID=A0ABS8UMR8_DATST|nr:hypothetical protein [Datura stramonium]
MNCQMSLKSLLFVIMTCIMATCCSMKQPKVLPLLIMNSLAIIQLPMILPIIFIEMASDYYSDTPHFMDFTKYPGVDERHNFIRMYLTFEGLVLLFSIFGTSLVVEVEQLADDVEKYTLASHLVYGLWGIISVTNAKNDDSFDYMKHAKQKI